jgi:hypothetical protein
MVAMGEHGSDPPRLERADSEYDVVDAEFTEVDDDRRGSDHEGAREPKFPPNPMGSAEHSRSKPRAPWLALILLLIGGVVAYRVFFRTDIGRTHEERTLPAGWLDLSSCSFTRSFDGTKWLTLADDQSAQSREALSPEQGKARNERVSTGKWSYDETSKQFSVTLNGETTDYTLLSQDGVATCILVKGGLSNANLRESWFATIDDSADDMPDYSE